MTASAHYFNEHPRQSFAGDTSKRYGDITRKRASSLRPSDPRHLTRKRRTKRAPLARVQRNPFSFYPLTPALEENVTSPVLRPKLTLTFW